MTAIAVWSGADSRGPASLYIAADSRITFDGIHWDQGRKVFASNSQPHIFGYWGRIDFPALALPLIADRIDRGFLAAGGRDAHTEVYQAIRRLWHAYPASQNFNIVHGMRIGEKMTSRFSIHVMTCKDGIWSTRLLPIPGTSTLILNEGSGRKDVRRAYDAWQEGQSANTSRAVFSAFCDAIAGADDSGTGGAPQLSRPVPDQARPAFGIVYDSKRYFAGAAMTSTEQTAGVEWRNTMFEITDGASKKREPGAQVHKRG